ncbi:uncharacterized protein E6C27_scaffold653G00030 [Cucumis melo var. makuwa]|uniref:Uncharacterized protein n=2 Tax=Cucumis melo TaxID=3656 RepID=A0A5A7SJ85_CUCMM|nr:uncharacterized protein E6C27_scaffold653G00030 [Cucumis melo var. makuwa]
MDHFQIPVSEWISFWVTRSEALQKNTRIKPIWRHFSLAGCAPTSLRGPRMVEFSGEGGAKYYTNLEARTHIQKEKSGADNVRKDLLILTTDKRPSTHTEDSHSNNDDRHWKRPKRPDKQSIDDEKPPIEVPDIEGTSKPMASPEDLYASENSKTPIGATAMSICPLVTKASPQRVGGTKPITTFEISHFCVDNLISDLRRKTAITLSESLRQKIICTPFERVSSLKPEMRKIFAAIATSDSNNLTFLKELVDGYFQGVENHNQMRSSILLQSTKDAQLMETKGFVKTLRLDENRILKETSTVQRRLARLSAKEAKLEAKLKVVRTESTKLSGMISKNEIELKQKQREISKTCEEIDKLKCALIIGDADAKMLSALRESLENTLEELKNLKWTP